jgi:hypothetical protein
MMKLFPHQRFKMIGHAGWSLFPIFMQVLKYETYRLCRRILFFHYFKELNDGVNTAPCLIRSLDIDYKLFQNLTATSKQKRNAEADYIIAVQQSGYIKKQGWILFKKEFTAF